MNFDHSKLRGRIVEKFGTCANFASILGIPESALSGRLNNKVQIDADEMVSWSAPELLDIAPAEMHIFFLTPIVR